MKSLLEKFNSELGETMNNYEITLHGERMKVASEETIITLVNAIRKTLRALDEEKTNNE